MPLSTILVLQSPDLNPPAPLESRSRADEQKKWTVMVYMAADNNLEFYGIEDMNEMERVGSSDDVNILVQFDRHPSSTVSSGYSGSNGDWTDTRRFYIEQDNDSTNFHDYTEDVNMWVIGETNMALEQTFEDFLNWALGNFSADHYLLVMWDHGEGIFSNGRGGARTGEGVSTGDVDAQSETGTRGVCNDETNGGWLNLWDMREALEKMKNKHSVTIDIISFDVCWIGGALETGYELMPFADYFTGSQEEEPNPGWNYYGPINSLVGNPNITPAELAKQIAKAFEEEYKPPQYTEDYYITYTAVDLNRFENYLIPLINNFADTMAGSIYDNYDIINNARANSDIPRRASMSYMRDFFHFAELIYQDTGATADLHEAAKAILDEYNQTIIEFVHGSKHPNSRGLIIYFPERNYNNEYNYKLKFSNEHWDDFIRLFITPIQIDHVPLNSTEATVQEFEIKAIIKGFRLNQDNIYVFYNSSKTDTLTPVQMAPTETDFEFSATITITNYDTWVFYYIRASEDTGRLVFSPQDLQLDDASTWYSFYVGTDLEPPRLTHDSLIDVFAEAYGEPYQFYVNITDNFGLDPNSLFFNYNMNNSDWYTSIPLSVASEPNRYYAVLPHQPANTIIYYYFTAFDTAKVTNTAQLPSKGVFKFNVSRTKPKAEFELSKYQFQTYEDIVFTSTSKPKDLIETYIWDFGDGSVLGTQMNETHQYTVADTYEVTLKVIDMNGLSDIYAKKILIVNSPPEILIDTDNILVNSEPRHVDSNKNLTGIVYEDDVIEIDCSGSFDKDGYITKRTWDFGDGNVYTEIYNVNEDRIIPVTMIPHEVLEKQLNSSFDGKLSYKYINVGNYTIRFSLTDNDESTVIKTILNVVITNCVPALKPTFQVRGLTVTFFAHKEDNQSIDSPSDMSSLNFTWNFGDGNYDYSPNPNHTFSERDKYEVTLTVIDDDGESTIEKFYVDLSDPQDYSMMYLGLTGIIILIIIIFAILIIIRRKKRTMEKFPSPLQKPVIGRGIPPNVQYRQGWQPTLPAPRQLYPYKSMEEPRSPQSMGDPSRPISTQRTTSESDQVKVKDILSKIQQK